MLSILNQPFYVLVITPTLKILWMKVIISVHLFSERGAWLLVTSAVDFCQGWVHKTIPSFSQEWNLCFSSFYPEMLGKQSSLLGPCRSYCNSCSKVQSPKVQNDCFELFSRHLESCHTYTLLSLINMYTQTNVFACFVDFEKAFDSIWHKWLLLKYWKMGLERKPLN